MKLLNFITFIFLIMTVALAQAGGNEGGGGGADVGLEFSTYVHSAISTFAQSGLADATAERIHRLNAFAAIMKVISTERELTAKIGDLDQPSVALNTPTRLMIEVNSDKWERVSDERVRLALALHEIESLAQEESTGDYHISNLYLASLGFSGKPGDALMNAALHLKEAGIPDLPAPKPALESYSYASHVSSLATDLATGEEFSPYGGYAKGLSYNFRDGLKTYTLKYEFPKCGDFDFYASFSSDALSPTNASGRRTDDVSLKEIKIQDGKLFTSGWRSEKIYLQKLGKDRNLVIGLNGDVASAMSVQPLEKGGFVSSLLMYPYLAEKMGSHTPTARVTAYTRIEIYKPLETEDSYARVARRLRTLLRGFRELHLKTVAAKGALDQCRAAVSTLGSCTAEENTYSALDRQRDLDWRNLMKESDARKSIQNCN